MEQRTQSLTLSDLDKAPGTPAKLDEATAQANTDQTVKVPDAPIAIVDPPVTTDNAAASGTEPGTEEPKEGDEAATEEVVTDPLQFWKDVDSIKGEPIEFDAKGAEPNSPEWVVARDRAIEDRAIASWEHDLEKLDPRGYAYLLHRSKGGTDEQFFETKIPSLPDYNVFKDNVDSQAEVYKRDLLNKGVDADDAEAMVQAAMKKGTIFTKADAVYKNTQKNIDNQLNQIKAQNEAKEQEFNTKVTQLKNNFDSIVTGNKLNITIPDTDKQGFIKFVGEMTREDGGKFYLLQPLEQDNMTKLLTSMYFLYKDGNLDALIKRGAKTQFVAKVKDAVDKANTRLATAGTGNNKKLTLGEL